jgi:valyl-tRNA synthetase
MRGDFTFGYRTVTPASPQMMVERQLRSEGKSRRDLGREAFIERVRCRRKQYGGANS